MLDFLNSQGTVYVSMVLGAVLGLSLYLPLLAGQLSLASPGFYALGGFVAAVMSTKTFDVEGTYPVGSRAGRDRWSPRPSAACSPSSSVSPPCG